MGTYRPTLGRVAVVAILVVAVVGTAGGVAVEARRATPSWAYVAYLVAITAWNVYLWSWRMVTRLSLGDVHLYWQTAGRSGSVPVADLTSVRSLRLVPNVVVLRGRGLPLLVVLPQKGFADFVDALAGHVPGVGIGVHRLAGVTERLPGPTAWRPVPGRYQGRAQPVPPDGYVARHLGSRGAPDVFGRRDEVRPLV